MNINQFIDQLRAIKFDCVFNPYSERCSIFDLENAPEIRSETLRNVLEKADATNLDSIWIGRDLGYRGGRRTGLAFTDDRHLEAHANRWGVKLQRSTHGDEVAERSATVLWQALSRVHSSVFLWNVFPLHPFVADRPLSNRSHNAAERNMGTELLVELIDLLQPRKLLPIGTAATHIALKVSGKRQVLPVRHPSYGGQRVFLEQVSKHTGTSHD